MKNFLCALFIFYSFVTFSQEEKDTIPQTWKVTGKLTFLLNQSAFSNWISGGSNTIAGNIGLNYNFNYNKKRWRWDNKLITSYGLSHIEDQGNRKTDDRLEFNSILGLRTGNHWFLSFFTNFITQYSTGYDYKKEPKVAISDFMSPGYWSFGPGMLWKKSDNERLNIAPATTRFTFVSREFSGEYGVDEGELYAFSLGFNLSGYYKFKLMENIQMENILAIYSDYLNNPQNIDIDYQLNFFVKVNKYISTNLGLHIIVDSDASSRIQFRQIFGLGLNYIFHKK